MTLNSSESLFTPPHPNTCFGRTSLPRTSGIPVRDQGYTGFVCLPVAWHPTEQELCMLQAWTQKTFFSYLLFFAVCVPLTVSQHSLQLLNLWEYAKLHTPPVLV